MLVKINWKPSTVELRKFGVALLVGFGLIGGLVYWRGGHTAAFWMWGLAGAVGALALLFPRASLAFYVVWMGLAFLIGSVVSMLMLFIIFFLIITPVAIFMRVFRRDPLRLRKEGFRPGTYWIEHPDLSDKDYYERLF